MPVKKFIIFPVDIRRQSCFILYAKSRIQNIEKEIKILAIETSCDETAAAVVVNGRAVRSNVISSQIDLHTLYGGVVPEIASRKHIEKIKR